MTRLTVGVAEFHASPAAVRKPGQAKTEWVKAGSELQWAIKDTVPWSLAKEVWPADTLDIMTLGAPARLLQAPVPVQIPMFSP